MSEEFVKYKKIIIIFIVFYVLLTIISITYKNTNKDKVIKNYILSKDFVLDDDKIFYKKDLSDITYEEYLDNVEKNISSSYDTLYFDIYTYSLNENRYEFDNGIETYLTSIYDYRDSSISYTYTIKYKTSNVIYKGTYKNNKFTCSNEYSLDAGINNDDSYCNLIEEYVKEFNDISMETISSSKILKYMKK